MDYKEISDNIKRYRYVNGLTQEELAERSGLSLPTIKNIEGGKPGIRKSTIDAIASALNLDISILSQPAGRLRTVHFRTCRNMRSKEGIIAQIINKLAIYNELERLTGQRTSELYKLVPVGKNAIHIAAECRRVLMIDSLSPVADITQTVADLGIKLFSVAIKSDKFFSLSVGKVDGGPAIIVNDNEHLIYEQIAFSIAHELGHFFMHSDEQKYVDDETVWAEEDEADLFASHFLMPENAFRRVWDANIGLHWTDRLIKVKHIFGVHYKTVLHRLGDFDKLDKLFKKEYKGGIIKNRMDPKPLSKSLFVESKLQGLAVIAISENKISVTKGAEMLNIDEATMKNLITPDM